MKAPTPIRTLAELVDVVQELIDSTGKRVYAEDLQEALDRVEGGPELLPYWRLLELCELNGITETDDLKHRLEDWARWHADQQDQP